MKVCTECNVFLIANSEFEEQDGCGPISFLYTHALLLCFLEDVRRTGLLVKGGKKHQNEIKEIRPREDIEKRNQIAALRSQVWGRYRTSLAFLLGEIGLVGGGAGEWGN